MKATTLLDNLWGFDLCGGKLTILILQRLQGLGFQEDEDNFSKVHRRDEKRMNIKVVVDMFDNFVISSVWNLIFRWNTVWAINKINCFVAMTNKKISLIFVTCKLSPCRLKLLGRTLKSDLSQMSNFRVKTFYQLLIIRPSGQLLCEEWWERGLELSLAWPQIWPRIYGAGSEREQGMRCSWCNVKDRSWSPSDKGVFSHLEATQREWTLLSLSGTRINLTSSLSAIRCCLCGDGCRNLFLKSRLLSLH